MGESTNHRRNGIEKVSHPYIQIIVAMMASMTTIGGASGFWMYLNQIEETKRLGSIGELEHQLKMNDFEAQLAATITIIADQGSQLKRLHRACDELTVGRRSAAREIIRAIDIPINQGLPIVAGKLVPTYEEVRNQRIPLEVKLLELQEAAKE